MTFKPNPQVQVKYTQIFINDQWQNSVNGRKFPVFNPATTEKICDVQEGDKADIDKAVASAKTAFKNGSVWRKMNAYERGRLLNKLADLVERDTEYLANLLTLENGKPFKHALREINFCLETIRYYAGCADKIHGKTIPVNENIFAYTRVEPVGVCALILSWNFPALLVSSNVAPALAAGNTVVLKPAIQTPLTSLYFVSLMKEAGFPPGVVNIVPGHGHVAGEALVRHLDVHNISYTGPTEIGLQIQEAAGKSNSKRMNFIMGGKNPLIVCSDVEDLDEAVQIALRASFYNQGESHCAGNRVFVQDEIYDAFVSKSKKLALKRVIGDPFDEKTEQGPQIDEKQLNKILEYVECGKREGAILECGGSRHSTKGYFMQATIFSNVQVNMRITKEEFLGPVMQISRFSTLEEVIARSNTYGHGLAAGIITEDVNKAINYSQQVRSGLVWINCYLSLSVQAPLGGFNTPGGGKDFGLDALKSFIELKTVSMMIRQKKF